MGILVFAIAILFLVAGGMVLSKAGESGWKILIPIYGMYCLYKIADAKGIFWGMLAVSFGSAAITGITVAQSISSGYYYGYSRGSSAQTIVPIITGILSICMLVLWWNYSKRMAEAFGKGKGFAAGLYVLWPIFFLILAFGSAEYKGYQGMGTGIPTVGTWKCPACGTENPQSRVLCQGCGQVK